MPRPAVVLASLALAALCGCGASRPAPPPMSGAASSASSASAPSAGSTSNAGPATWAGLGTLRPLWIRRSAPGPAADPAQPGLLAYCAAGAVRISRDGGSTWRSFPTSGAVAATAASPYPILAQGGPPTCREALADPGHPGSAYAAFSAGPAGAGMPPVYAIPLYTTDGGAHWHLVTPPPGFGPGGFGGFRVTRSGVQAMFGQRPGTSALAGPSFATTSSRDGGGSWQPGTAACPATGPCAIWGPAPSGIGSCAMNAYPQPVLLSPDGGRRWTALPPPTGAPLPILANGCAPNQLAALGGQHLALVLNGTGAASGTVRLSSDGGKTWTAVRLPALPGGGTQALQLLPDGSLLAPVLARQTGGGYGLQLQRLAPGASAWCTVPAVELASGTNPATLQAAGGHLWWVGTGGLTGVPLTAVRCQPSSH